MHNLIDLVGRNTGAQCGSRNVQNFSGQPAHLPHAFYRLGVEDLDLVGPDKRPAGLRDTVLGVIRAGYVVGHGTSRGERVDRSQRAGILEVRPRIEVAGLWIGFSYSLWREEVAKNTIFLLMYILVCSLADC